MWDVEARGQTCVKWPIVEICLWVNVTGQQIRRGPIIPTVEDTTWPSGSGDNAVGDFHVGT